LSRRWSFGGQLLGCDHDDRDRPPGLVPAQLGQELEAIHLGHHEVEDDQTGRRLLDARERGPPVLGLHHGVALSLQQPADQLPELSVVVHDQNGQILPVAPEHGQEALAVDRLGQVRAGARNFEGFNAQVDSGKNGRTSRV
jgi:hypothetical protein